MIRKLNEKLIELREKEKTILDAAIQDQTFVLVETAFLRVANAPPALGYKI
jgi:hypothetical protein